MRATGHASRQRAGAGTGYVTRDNNATHPAGGRRARRTAQQNGARARDKMTSGLRPDTPTPQAKAFNVTRDKLDCKVK